MNQATLYVERRWLSIEGEFYSTGGDRFNPPGLDCSGAVKFANRDIVDPLARGWWGDPMPTISATVADWAIRHGLVIPMSRLKPFDLLIYDKYGQPTQGYGNRGHIGQVSANPAITWESASSRGTQRYTRTRLGWSMCVDMSSFWGKSPPMPSGPTKPAVNWAAIKAAQTMLARRRNPMILLRHTDTSIYVWDGGLELLHLDPVTLKVVVDMMNQRSLVTTVHNGQDYLIDSIKRQKVQSEKAGGKAVTDTMGDWLQQQTLISVKAHALLSGKSEQEAVAAIQKATFGK